MQLERIQSAPSQALIERQQAREVEVIRAKLKIINEQYRQKQKEYQDLRAETIKVIQGSGHLNADLLNSLVDETTGQIKALEEQIQAKTAELEETIKNAERICQEYAKLMNWADLYDNCTFEAKKVIAAQFVKAVHVKGAMR